MSIVLTDFNQVALYVFDEYATVTIGASSTVTPSGTLLDRTLSNTLMWTYVTDVPNDFEFGKYKYGPSLGWTRNSTLASAKDEIKLAIRNKRLESELKGIFFGGKRFSTTRQNQNHLMSLYYALDKSLIADIYYAHQDSTYTNYTTSTIKSLLECVFKFVRKVALNEYNHATAVDALSTVDTVMSYDYTTGWLQEPPTADSSLITADDDTRTADENC